MSIFVMNGIAKKFWEESRDYPEYGNIEKRRLFELNYLVPKLKGESILDLGCGDGSLLNCLIHLTNFKKFFGYDLSANLLKKVNPIVETKVYDCYNPQPLPPTDVTIMTGLLIYLFEDEVVENILSLVKSPTIFIRTTCTLGKEDELINNFSQQLQKEYAAFYRTLPHTMELISRFFKIESVDRIYPDEIESKFGTKQFYIKATRL